MNAPWTVVSSSISSLLKPALTLSSVHANPDALNSACRAATIADRALGRFRPPRRSTPGHVDGSQSLSGSADHFSSATSAAICRPTSTGIYLARCQSRSPALRQPGEQYFGLRPPRRADSKRCPHITQLTLKLSSQFEIHTPKD